MIVFGLTGGVATGKTTVANHLRRMGAVVIEADEVGREVAAAGSPVLEEIGRAFGSDFLTQAGDLDRKKMADLVFGDPQARCALNALMHPPMVGLIRKRVERFREETASPPGLVVVAAILYEMGLDRLVEGVLALTASRFTQIRRLEARGILGDEAQRRIEAQTPREVLAFRARWLVSTDRTLDETLTQVEAIWLSLLSEETRATV